MLQVHVFREPVDLSDLVASKIELDQLGQRIQAFNVLDLIVSEIKDLKELHVVEVLDPSD